MKSDKEIIGYIKTTHVIDFVRRSYEHNKTLKLNVNGEDSEWLPLGLSGNDVSMQKQTTPCNVINIPVISFYDSIICTALRRNPYKA